ncbi:MAG TPA: glycosyltransferase family 1 protein, partial [Tepiditoga sp.]|nr:glycosyltransferase family 1 protein [Tepiditoga sp.]
MNKKLHIAIEAFPLSDDNLTGIGNVCKNLIESLYRIDKETKFTILLKGGTEHLNINSSSWDFIYSKKKFFTIKRNRLKADLSVEKTAFIRIQYIFFWFINAIFFLGYLSILPFILWSRKIDVYIGLSPNFFPYIFIGNKIKRVTFLHDFIWKLFPHTMERLYRVKMVAFIKYNLRRTDFLFANSENTKNDYIKLFRNRSKVYTTLLAADKEFYYTADNKSISAVKSKYNIDNKYIISVCTLEPRKNLDTLLKAFSLLDREQYKLVLVGEKGWISTNFYENLTSLEIRDRIIITGYIPKEDMAPLYSGAEVFVYPSLYEGFG